MGVGRGKVVRVQVGQDFGTGFLIAPRLLLTALHVVADVNDGQIRARAEVLLFYGSSEAPPGQADESLEELDVVGHDVMGDWIVVRVSGHEGQHVWPLAKAQANDSDRAWSTFGFPCADGAGADGNLVTIDSPQTHEQRHEKRRLPALQLFVQQAAAGEGQPMRGYSGAPVVISGCVVGALVSAAKPVASGRNAGAVRGGTIYARPIELVAETLGLPLGKLPDNSGPPRTVGPAPNHVRLVLALLATVIALGVGYGYVAYKNEELNSAAAFIPPIYNGVLKAPHSDAGLAGARVAILESECSSVTTDTRGRFHLNCEDSYLPDFAHVEITLADRAIPCDADYAIHRAPFRNVLEIDPDTCRMTALEDNKSVVLNLHILTDLDVNLLLAGKLATQFGAAAHQGITAKNEALTYLEGLCKESASSMWSGYDGLPIETFHSGEEGTQSRHWPDTSEAADAVMNSPDCPLVDSHGYTYETPFTYDYIDNGLAADIEMAEFVNMLQSGKWNPRKRWGDAYFWKYSDRADILRVKEQAIYNGGALADFYLKITSGHFPEEFLVTVVRAEDGEYACGDGFAGRRGLSLVVIPRHVAVVVALLENTSPVPVTVDELQVKKAVGERLRTLEADRADTEQAVTTAIVPYGPKVLKPGEILVVPLRLLLGYRYAHQNITLLPGAGLSHPAAHHTLKMLDKLSIPPDEVGDLKGTTGRIEVDVAGITWAGQPFPTSGDFYVIGPSTSIVAAKIDGVSYHVREEKTSSLYMRIETGGLSCPFIYARSPSATEYERRGKILVGNEGKSKEGPGYLRVNEFTGTIVLAEHEREISYIDHIYFVDDNARVWKPTNNDALSVQDGRYEVLRRGDVASVTFGEWANGVSGTIYAYGYYIGARD